MLRLTITPDRKIDKCKRQEKKTCIWGKLRFKQCLASSKICFRIIFFYVLNYGKILLWCGYKPTQSGNPRAVVPQISFPFISTHQHCPVPTLHWTSWKPPSARHLGVKFQTLGPLEDISIAIFWRFWQDVRFPMKSNKKWKRIGYTLICAWMPVYMLKEQATLYAQISFTQTSIKRPVLQN